MIWLSEGCRRDKRHDKFRIHLEASNAHVKPGLSRLAMKMATGSGKTTVMAMLIAWQTVNAVRTPGSALYSRGFLVVAPGITIKDRLRVLQPTIRTATMAPASSCLPSCYPTSTARDSSRTLCVVITCNSIAPRVEPNAGRNQRGAGQ